MTRRVLIADDDEDMRELLGVVLHSASYTIVGAAADGDEALSMWRTKRSNGICAVILDERMPGLSGIEVAKAIRDEDPAQQMILLSAHIDGSMERRATEAGIVACVPKQDVLKMPTNKALVAACPDRG